MPTQTAQAKAPPATRQEAVQLLKDTARAVKVMKASWLHVALNLRRIRQHKLWQYNEPPCQTYDEYVLGVLKLNKYVANRMLTAMSYTEERRPEIMEEYARRGDDADVPSYDVVNQLRRVESYFEDREEDFRNLESRVYDDGVGRVTLKREIDEKLGRDQPPPSSAAADAPDEEVSVEKVLEMLRQVEKHLIRLKVSKEARELAFRLVETLQKEK